MSNQTSSTPKETILKEILRMTAVLKTKVETLPIDDDNDNISEAKAKQIERKAIISDSIRDLKSICHLLEAIDNEK